MWKMHRQATEKKPNVCRLSKSAAFQTTEMIHVLNRDISKMNFCTAEQKQIGALFTFLKGRFSLF